MIEVMIGALVVSNLAVLALYAYSERLNRLERSKLVNALIAKTSVDLRDLELTDKVKPIATTMGQNDFIPESDASDAEFMRMINNTEAGG